MTRPIVHFEIAGADISQTAEFYRELFGWRVGEEQMDGYRLVDTGEGSIGGGLMKTPPGVPAYVTVYVSVEDLEAALRRAEELGGKTMVEPMPIPGFGTFAMVGDPQGAMVGLFEETG
jgi:predicted enzyme related to lactoylglutathione lyase